MIISTYNIWNSSRGMPERIGQIAGEILKTDSDIICLQEVADNDIHSMLSAMCGYKYTYFQEASEISIFSRYPVIQTYKYEYAAAAEIRIRNKALLVINVFLPWESALKREKAIVRIINQTSQIAADYVMLAGDFNCPDTSSVHRYLKGEQSLLDSEACFFDLAESYSGISGAALSATLNFRKNPRWRNADGTSANTIEVNQRFDRIMLKNPYPEAFPTLKSCGVFGTEISDKTKLSASDHYGVFAELTDWGEDLWLQE